MSQFAGGKLGEQLDNLHSIAQLCASYLDTHRPKENDNQHRDRPCQGTNYFTEVALLKDR